MKAIISTFLTLIFIWSIYVTEEYFRCYQNGGTPLMGYSESTDDYIKRGGLGFYYINYYIADADKKNGDVLKEFYLIKWPVSQEKVVIIEEYGE